MIRFILLNWLLMSSLCAVGSDFYAGLSGEAGEAIPNIPFDQPETFPEVKATDPPLSLQNDIPRYDKDKRIRNTKIRNPQTNTASGLLHGYKHAGPGGNVHLFDYPQQSPEAYQAMASLVDNTLEQPLATQYGMWSKDGKFYYTGYLGEKDGKFFEIRIPEESIGEKIVKGKFKTIVPIDDSAMKHKWPKFFQNGLYRQHLARYRAPDIPNAVTPRNPFSNQRYQAPEIPKVGANIPPPTPRPTRVPIIRGKVTGIGNKVAGVVGGLAIDCTIGAVTAKVTEGDVAGGCVDGVAGTEPVADGTVTGQEELDLGTAFRHGRIKAPHPDHKLIDKAGKGLLESRVNFRTSRILDGPYQGKCIAVKSGYTVAVECGSLAGHEKVGRGPELVIPSSPMGNGMYFPF